jgi:hypothetical protein
MSDQIVRPGLQTSEFWLTALYLVILALSNKLGLDEGALAAAAAAVGLYAGARGYTKGQAASSALLAGGGRGANRDVDGEIDYPHEIPPRGPSTGRAGMARLSSILLVALVALVALLGLTGCQHVGPALAADAGKLDDRTAGAARTGMLDNDGNWFASGAQMSGTTRVDGAGIDRTNGGVADSLFYHNGDAIAIASNKDVKILASEFYTPDGQLIAKIGELSSGASDPTRASNEALDRMDSIIKTLAPAQLDALKAQLQAVEGVAQVGAQAVLAYLTGLPAPAK